MQEIAVIGGSGKVGRRIIAALQDAPVRAIARSEESAAALDREHHVQVVRADLDDPSTLPSALAGIRRLLIVTPYAPQQGKREVDAIEAASNAGVEHIVKISSYAAGLEPEIPVSRGHKIAERALRDAGISWTVLRPDWWFDNLTMQAGSLRDGQLFFPAGGACVTAIDARDIADIAAAELLAERPHGGVLTLTGPDTLDFPTLSARLAAALGRPLTFVDDVSPAWPQGYGEAMRALFAHYQLRGPAPFTHTVSELLGRPPRTAEQFAREVLEPLLGATEA